MSQALSATAGRSSSYRSGLYRRAAALGAFLLPIFGLLVVWEIAVRSGLDSTILPAPTMIVMRGWTLLDAGDPGQSILLLHIAVSLWRALASFVLACVVAIPLGFLLGLSPSAYHAISPLLSLLLPLPAVAWKPIFLV